MILQPVIPEKEKRLKRYLRLQERIQQVLERDKLRRFSLHLELKKYEECGLKPGPTVGKIKGD